MAKINSGRISSRKDGDYAKTKTNEFIKFVGYNEEGQEVYSYQGRRIDTYEAQKLGLF